MPPAQGPPYPPQAPLRPRCLVGPGTAVSPEVLAASRIGSLVPKQVAQASNPGVRTGRGASVLARAGPQPSSEAMAGGDEPLADALWEAAAFVLGWGARADLVAAAAAAAAGAREQLDAVLAETRERLAIDARPDSCTIENARRHRPR